MPTRRHQRAPSVILHHRHEVYFANSSVRRFMSGYERRTERRAVMKARVSLEFPLAPDGTRHAEI